MMRYSKVSLADFTCALPDNIVSSDEIELRLKPLYERLRLPEGRLELMTGIRERRFWGAGYKPSDGALLAGRKLLARSGLEPEQIGAMVYCAVSRDFVEPATSTVLHRELGLSSHCLNFDISNACLGMVSGILTLANMIELGQIEAGIALCGENAGPLLENTIASLNADLSLTRSDVKTHFASLTIGSAAAAALVRRAQPGQQSRLLLAAASYSDCSNNHLCQGDARGGMTDASQPLMQTDSQELLQQGVKVAAGMWQKLKKCSAWQAEDADLICTHQVGKFHRALLYETLGLPLEKDYSSFPILGNCGSASLPATCALALEQGCLKQGDKLLMLGIGSGINATGLAVQW
ncbi:MAG: 3-oxoacyl-ACP synthase III [Oligosphaeraceae bacterium]|nr:3-oxoacyl-ACP synthase III [Oligosphaeraceae bacterium]